MTYFPLNNFENKPVKCPGCGKWHEKILGMLHQGCCVMHGPGTCCHFGEREVEEPETIILKVRNDGGIPLHAHVGEKLK